MRLGILIRLFFCILSLGYFLYLYLIRQNAITELRLEIPVLQKEVNRLEEDNIRLQYCIDTFENPVHLMELLRSPEYRHLKHPLTRNIVTLPQTPR